MLRKDKSARFLLRNCRENESTAKFSNLVGRIANPPYHGWGYDLAQMEGEAGRHGIAVARPFELCTGVLSWRGQAGNSASARFTGVQAMKCHPMMVAMGFLFLSACGEHRPETGSSLNPAIQSEQERQEIALQNQKTSQAEQERIIAEINKLGGYAGKRVESPEEPVEVVQLDEAKITDDWLVNLKGLPYLKNLRLPGTNVTGVGLAHLKGLTRLEDLDLRYTKVTDDGLTYLNGLPELSWLYLGKTSVTDAGLAHLAGFSKLKFLDLRDTKITDAGLVHLQKLPKLQALYLSETKVSDAGLVHLKKLTHLQTIDVKFTKLTEAGVNELKKALPRAKIWH
jgi:hypothetical protein